MQTPWGDIAVSDAHVHFFSHSFFTKLGAPKGITPEQMQPILGWEMPPELPEDLASRWIQEIARAGVESAALIASIHGDHPSVVAAIKAYPENFHGYFMLDASASNAIAIAGEALDSGMRGICLFPAMHRYGMHDERLMPLLELAASRPGTVVFVHCGVLTVGVRKKLGLPSPFDMRFSNPLDLHALALRFPNLPFILPHFGAGMFREALMLADLCPNVYFDTSSSNSWMQYQESGLTLPEVFRKMLRVAGPGRLLFGTDSSFFPRGWNAAIFHDQAAALAEVGIGEAEARLIFGENLRRLIAS
jgi:predicted TIM-barrel fold metal-dependent hydrolase